MTKIVLFCIVVSDMWLTDTLNAVLRVLDKNGYARAPQCCNIRRPILPAFLGAFQKLRKQLLASSFVSVSLSVHMGRVVSH